MIFDDTPRQYRLYVLELEGGKYYVGVTSRTALQLMREHQKGIKSAFWTGTYKPKRIVSDEPIGLVPYREAVLAEQKKTLEYMKKYGPNSVRGGELRERSNYVFVGKYVLTQHDRDVIIVLGAMLAVIAILTAMLYLRS